MRSEVYFGRRQRWLSYRTRGYSGNGRLRYGTVRSMSTCVVLFVKKPAPGFVKTRLHDCCSPEEAADIYRAFVVDSARIVQQTKAELKIVAYDPPEAEGSVADLLGDVGFTYVPQLGGDLGERMHRMIRRSREMGATRTVIIGSDSPSLPPGYVDDALELLRSNGVVLGPSTDGGYYLIGQSSPDIRPFRSIDWSTGSVFEQTLQRLEGTAIALLPPWYDVDTPAEAAFLRVHLEALERAGEIEESDSLQVLRNFRLPPPS